MRFRIERMKPENSSASRQLRDLNTRRLRSALTNGSRLVLGDIDERSPWCRRLRDLLTGYSRDLGGDATLSEGQRALVRRAVMLQLQLEMLEARFVENDGAATPFQLGEYQRASGALRRLIESVGLHTGRIAENVSQTSYNATADIVEAIRERANA